MTLKDIWQRQGREPTELAAAAKITVQTLYKMNRKEPTRPALLHNVLRELQLTPEDYNGLEAGRN